MVIPTYAISIAFQERALLERRYLGDRVKRSENSLNENFPCRRWGRRLGSKCIFQVKTVNEFLTPAFKNSKKPYVRGEGWRADQHGNFRVRNFRNFRHNLSLINVINSHTLVYSGSLVHHQARGWEISRDTINIATSKTNCRLSALANSWSPKLTSCWWIIRCSDGFLRLDNPVRYTKLRWEWSGYRLILSRDCSSHVTTYFSTFVRTFESMLCRVSNIRLKVIVFGSIHITQYN